MKINFSYFPVFTLLKENVLSNLSPLYKKILTTASITFALLAAAYVITKCCFFKGARILDKKEETVDKEWNEINEDDPQEDNPFANLPNELLIHIFSTLPVKEWNAISLANQKFHTLSYDPQVIATLLENEDLNIPFDQYLKLAKQAGPHLKTLKLNKTALTDQQLKDLIKACPHIQKLNLSETRITDHCLAHLKSLVSLQHLILSLCYTITDTGLAHLRSHAHLRYLNLRRCDKITNAGLTYLISHPTLGYLDLSGCTNITDTNIADFKNFSPQVKLIL